MPITHEFTDTENQVTPKTKFYTVALNMCGSLVRNLLYIMQLVPGNLRWLLDFWKIFGPLV
jgi:hypothetical protein